MTSEPRNLLNPFEILAIVSVCGVLFMAAHREVGLALWTIPAMTLFTVAGLTLLCVLLFDGVPGDRRAKNLGRCRDMGRSPPSGHFFRFYVDFPIQQVPLVLAV